MHAVRWRTRNSRCFCCAPLPMTKGLGSFNPLTSTLRSGPLVTRPSTCRVHRRGDVCTGCQQECLTRNTVLLGACIRGSAGAHQLRGWLVGEAALHCCTYASRSTPLLWVRPPRTTPCTASRVAVGQRAKAAARRGLGLVDLSCCCCVFEISPMELLAERHTPCLIHATSTARRGTITATRQIVLRRQHMDRYYLWHCALLS